MADRQPPPQQQQQQTQPLLSDHNKRMSLDKIIEAMTADLEGSSGHYVQFGVPPLPSSSPPSSSSSSQAITQQNWNDYVVNNHNRDNYTVNQSTMHHSSSLPTMNTINPIQPVPVPVQPIFLQQDVPIIDTATGERIYIPPQSVNHLGINENNDLIGTIDIGGGNFINVIYGNASQIVSDNNMSYVNTQNVDYGLFGEQLIQQQQQQQHNNDKPNGKQLIDNLVGNWVPNQSGTYSPFGGSPNVTPVPAQMIIKTDIDDNNDNNNLPTTKPTAIVRQQQQKKTRIIAEVKPMRPSYSSVLTKSPPLPPLPSSPLNISQQKQQSQQQLQQQSQQQQQQQQQGQQQTDIIINKKIAGKSSKNKNKNSILKRQNSSGSDDHGSPKIQLPKKPLENNNSNLPRRWVSLDNLGQNESHDIDPFNGSDQFEKRKNTKTNNKNNKNDTLNNNNNNNKNKINENGIQKRTIQINNNVNQTLFNNNNEKIDKNNKIIKDDKKLTTKDIKNSKRYHNEKSISSQQLKKGQKYRKRDNRESTIKNIWKNINKYSNRWSKIALQIIIWLLNLISDVVSMSTNLVIQFVKLLWYHTVLYFKYSMTYFLTTIKNIHILNTIGKKIDYVFGKNSRFAFWRRLYKINNNSHSNSNNSNNKNRKKQDDKDDYWLQGGLEINISLPSTGEEAMKRLLACKGKDPYSILGVTPTCLDDDIKKYYKRQAFLVHPDKNNQPGAEEAFKILVHAFDIIGEPERRKAFDQSRQVEAAWGELSDLLSQLHRKMEQAANTIRCTNCGNRHKRIPTQRPCYAARFCAQCKIRHSAKEGDIWAESRVMGFLWHYYACMEGAVYDVTDWAACQAGNLKHLRANTHSVQYRIVLGQRPPSQTSTTSNKKRQQADGSNTNDAGLEDFLNNLYNQSKSGSSTTTGSAATTTSSSATTTTTSSTTTTATEQPTSRDNRRRKSKRK